MLSRGRIEWLDLFRGLAAIVVVLFHYRDILGIHWLDFGYVAVDMFFVLSGIVLGRRYTDEIASGMPIRKFVLVRLRRLYPMVFIAAAFVVAMNFAGIPSRPYLLATREYAWMLFLVLPLPKAWPMGVSFPADFPMWSLWAELASNLVWYAAVKYGRRWLRYAGVGLLLIMIWMAHNKHSMDMGVRQGVGVLFFALVRALAWFSVGCVIAANRQSRALPVLPILAALMVAFAFYNWHPSWVAAILSDALGALLLQALYLAKVPIPSVAWAAKWLGKWSFPLYLLHIPAGRLIPYLPASWPTAVSSVFAVIAVSIVGMFCNEFIVERLHRRPKSDPH